MISKDEELLGAIFFAYGTGLATVTDHEEEDAVEGQEQEKSHRRFVIVTTHSLTPFLMTTSLWLMAGN